MTGEHLNPHRGWTLIRDGGQFSPDEVDHLKECSQCSAWLSLFADLARGAGFRPEFEFPFFFIAEDQHLTAGRAWSLSATGGNSHFPKPGISIPAALVTTGCRSLWQPHATRGLTSPSTFHPTTLRENDAFGSHILSASGLVSAQSPG